jgi:5-(carboxyamino)imidazole ribonucleotide synthase
VVTSAVEHVPPATLAAAARAAAVVRPSGALFAVAQDRALEREWLAARGVPLAAWRAVSSLGDALDAFSALGRRCVLKPALRRGVAADVRRIGGAADLVRAFIVLGAGRCVLEEALTIDAELSVVVARTPGGELATYPPAESRRAEHEGAPRLALTVLPATVPPAVAEKARRLAATVAARLGVEGILAVELFLLADGRLVVNEVVPCPHATFLAASHACVTDQYEQLVRAVCDLPLGPTDVNRPVAVMPIYGDEWASARPERVALALRVPGVTLRRYDARAGDDHADPSTRVAHLAATGDTSPEAVAKLVRARAWLGSNARGGARRAPRRERAGDTPQAV